MEHPFQAKNQKSVSQRFLIHRLVVRIFRWEFFKFIGPLNVQLNKMFVILMFKTMGFEVMVHLIILCNKFVMIQKPIQMVSMTYHPSFLILNYFNLVDINVDMIQHTRQAIVVIWNVTLSATTTNNNNISIQLLLHHFKTKKI